MNKKYCLLLRMAPAFMACLFCAADLSGWDFDHDFGANFAYYLDDNRNSASGASGFLPPSYKPMYPEDSAQWKNGHYSWLNSSPASRRLGNGWGAVEIETYYRFRARQNVLEAEGPLMKDNNITFMIKPVLSPVTLHVETEIQFTPIGFFELTGGVAGGFGWPLRFMNLEGLALNDQDDITDTKRSGWAGFYFVAGTIQFDLAALVPGKWNHLIFLASAKARYMHYSRAGALDAWYWRADRGENFNGWEYRGNYVIGYQPPWQVDFIGFLAEHWFWLSKDVRELAPINADYRIGNPAKSALPEVEAWGSDFQNWRFGPAVNLVFEDDHNLTFLLQFRNGLYYTEETVYARWFKRFDATGDRYVEFERLAIAYGWDF